MQPRIRTQALALPRTTFGPLRLLQALPWLVLAAAMRVIAFEGGAVALPAIFVATIAVLHAFVAMTRRSIELSGGSTGLGDLTLAEELQLTLAILWRIGLLMTASAVIFTILSVAQLMPIPVGIDLLGGLDGMAFDQLSAVGKPWSVVMASLVLLMMLGAERSDGAVSLAAASREWLARWRWLCVAVATLTLTYFALSWFQGLAREAIGVLWQTSANQFVKNLTFFVFIFSFAMLRLWLTLLVLTWSLKQSYLRETSPTS